MGSSASTRARIQELEAEVAVLKTESEKTKIVGDILKQILSEEKISGPEAAYKAVVAECLVRNKPIPFEILNSMGNQVVLMESAKTDARRILEILEGNGIPADLKAIPAITASGENATLQLQLLKDTMLAKVKEEVDTRSMITTVLKGLQEKDNLSAAEIAYTAVISECVLRGLPIPEETLLRIAEHSKIMKA